MTATQFNPIVTTADSLPEAIRDLERAELGALATVAGREGASAIRMGDGGTPWLLDPQGHNEGPAYVTTAYLATQGYRVTRPARRLDFEPLSLDDETFAAHIESLREAGWTPVAAAEVTAMAASTVRLAFGGKRVSEATRERLLAVGVDDPMPHTPMTRAERVEAMEWLLGLGVDPESVARRCGYGTIAGARKALEEAGSDFAPRIPWNKAPLQNDDLDDYDPYQDPSFTEEAA